MATEITADLVKRLRELTGVGMMECKKALVAANGDIDQATEDLRKAGQAKAVKKGARVAAEGVVVAKVAANNQQAVIVEINCETDFVAREDKFKHFANAVAEVAIAAELSDVASLAKHSMAGIGKSVEDARLELVAQLGENVAIRRISYLQTKTGVIGSYLHGAVGAAKIGALAVINTSKTDLAKDIAMQVAAMKPEYISEADVDAVRLAKEKEILLVQAQEANQGKPADILDKIVTGMVSKFLREITLLGQASIKEPKQTIEQILKAEQTQVTTIARFEVGEGIEKQADNFVDEVMSQVRNS